MLPAPLPNPLTYSYFAHSSPPPPPHPFSSISTRPRLVLPTSSHYCSSYSSPASSHSPAGTTILDDDSPSSPNYYYVNRGSDSFGSPSPVTEMYDNDPLSAYPTSSSSPSNIYHQPLPPSTNYSIPSVTDIRESDAPSSYHSDSPSPPDVHASARLFYPSAEQDPSSSSSFHQDPDEDIKLDSHFIHDRDSNPHFTDSSFQDSNQRRMSEPSIQGFSPDNNSSSTTTSTSRYPYGMPPYTAPLRPAQIPIQRGHSFGSLRDVRHHHQHHHHQQQQHQQHQQHLPFPQPRPSYDDSRHIPQDALESPISPLEPNFSAAAAILPDSYNQVVQDPYGPSPPGTGTSSSSNARGPIGVSQTSVISDSPGFPPADISEAIPASSSERRKSNNADPSSRTYSFVALPGNAVRKRPRRRYDEIERLYQCSWPDCNKSYGTLNHLNAHVTMQKHGPKRSPNEFKELRKQWRKAKKEQEAVATAAARRAVTLAGSERDFYDRHDVHHYTSSQQRYPFSTPQSLPSLSPASRYAAGDDFYSNPVERHHFTAVPIRRYSESGIGSPWNIPSSTRSSYMSSSLPSHAELGYNYGGQPLESAESSSYSPERPHPPHMMTGRLPPNSTLLTPLPGYEPRETLPPMQVGGDMTYEPESYYDDENGARSSSAHANRGRGDEF